MYDQQLVSFEYQDDRLALKRCEEKHVTDKPEIEIDNPELTLKKVPTAWNQIKRLEKNQCNVCRKKFQNKWNLERHQKSHIKTTSTLQENQGLEVVLETLGQTLGVDLGEIEEREIPETSEIKHKKKRKPALCIECNRLFYDIYKLRRHNRRIHSKPQNKSVAIENCAKKKVREKKIPCNRCDRKFRDNYDLKKHLNNVHSIVGASIKLQERKLFQCLECERHFSDSSHLKQHSKIHSKTQTEIFGKKTVLQETNATKETNATHKLNNKLQSTSKKLKKPKPAQCLECKRLFYDIHTLRRHNRRKHSKPKIEIPGKKTVTQEAFNKTIPSSKSHNKKKKRKPVQCLDCKRWFKDSSHLKQHCRIHSKAQTEIHGKKEAVQEVHDTSEQNSNLLDTSTKFEGSKHVQCDKCERKFSDIAHLKQHSVIHSETKVKAQVKKTELELEKSEDIKPVDSISKSISKKKNDPALCNLCKKLFRDKWKLKRHLDSSVHAKVHAGIKKPVPCTVCEKSYESKNSLDRHMRAHHPEKMV